MVKIIPPPAGIKRCPYLGLHDDSSTCLAYPSAWNYCYRAVPHAPALVSHQAETCLTAEYAGCPVYASDRWQRLPARLRAGSRAMFPGPGAPAKAGRWVLAAGLLLLLILTLLQPQPIPEVGQKLEALFRQLAGPFLASQPRPEALPADPSVPVGATASFGEPAALSATPPTARPAPSATRSVSPAGVVTAASIRPEACGHALDVPFGSEVKLLLHRVVSGENLTLYAQEYRTSTEAIQAVNYRLPMPVWEDWIIVIPVGATEVSGLPPFEPYQAIGARLSAPELAGQLQADPALLTRYNAFEGACSSFSGWLVIPREPAKP